MEIKTLFELLDFYKNYVFELSDLYDNEYYYQIHLSNMFYMVNLFKTYGEKLKSITFYINELIPDYIYMDNKLFWFNIGDDNKIIGVYGLN